LALFRAGRPAPGRAPPRAIDYSCGLNLFKAAAGIQSALRRALRLRRRQHDRLLLRRPQHLPRRAPHHPIGLRRAGEARQVLALRDAQHRQQSAPVVGLGGAGAVSRIETAAVSSDVCAALLFLIAEAHADAAEAAKRILPHPDRAGAIESALLIARPGTPWR
jgi:hypothetical protein